MKASPDNIFVGAKVTKDGKEFTVIKVNSKSFYLAPISYESYQNLWDMRPKKETFKDFCKRQKFLMDKYDGYEIDEQEVSKKALIDESQKGKNLYKLDKAVKLIIEDDIKHNKLRTLTNQSCGSKIFRIVEMRDKDKFLINYDNDYVLYNSSIDTSVKIGTVFDGFTKDTIPWEKICLQNS